MKYICQIKEGYMLAQEGTDDKLVITFTGYPYPDTEKSSFEMMQDLLDKYCNIKYTIEFYQRVFPVITDYLWKIVAGGHPYSRYRLSVRNIYTAILEADAKEKNRKRASHSDYMKSVRKSSRKA